MLLRSVSSICYRLLMTVMVLAITKVIAPNHAAVAAATAQLRLLRTVAGIARNCHAALLLPCCCYCLAAAAATLAPVDPTHGSEGSLC